MSNIPEITLAPSIIGQIGPITVTNAMLSYFAVCLLLIIVGLIVRAKLSVKPGRFQMFFELLFSMILDKMVVVFGDEKRARQSFPIVFTIFILLIFGNYFTLLPLVESFILDDGTKILTTPTAHYSLTIALAFLMIGTSHVLAIAISPIRHIGNFIKIGPVFKAIKNLSPKDFAMSMIDVFLGLLDIIGEIAKLISISTRLFGNMFAGGVIIAIVSGLSVYTQFVVPLPFAVLGLLTGFVQAFVFAMLGMLYISSLVGGVTPAKQQTETN